MKQSLPGIIKTNYTGPHYKHKLELTADNNLAAAEKKNEDLDINCCLCGSSSSSCKLTVSTNLDMLTLIINYYT